MKKIKYILLTILLLIPFSANASIHCDAPSSVESGETFGVTFYGSISGAAPIWIAKLGSEGNVTYSSGNRTVAGEEDNNFSRTIYYTAGNPGTATFYAYDVDVASDTDAFSGSDTCTVTITEATAPNGGDSSYSNSSDDDDDEDEKSNKSSNNSLKSLSIEGVKISPGFSKDKLEYSAVVNGDKEKITIKAELEDEKASIEGIGEKELKEGTNKFEIKVTAENGDIKKYVLSVTRKEKNPIEVVIDKKKYTVAKKDVGLKVPEGFVKTSVVIQKEDVLAYSNSDSGYLIVALVDEKGKANWYIYNQKNGTYTKYSEFVSDGVRLIVLKANKKDVPYNYKKVTFKYNDSDVEGYYLQYESSYRLIYALNVKTKEKGFYLYDMKENTFQRFYNAQATLYRSFVKKLEILIIGLGSVIALMLFVIVSLVAVNKKTKKFIKLGGKNDDTEEKKDKEIIKAEEEFDKTEEQLSKKDIKRKEKELKKKMKEERKNFLE